MTRGWPDAALDWRHMDGSWFRDEWPKGRRSDVKAAAPARGHSVRVLARLRPFLDNEEEPSDIPCLRTVGSSQLEVLLEPRALLTDTACRRGRRRTIGGLHDIGSCKSAASMPSVSSRGLFESPFLPVRGLESRTFSFDQVFDANASDDQVFSEIQDELQAALEGEAVCILAYGATGSGKTHTVTNIAERVAQRLNSEADLLEKEGSQLEVLVQIVEIYNEHFRDLLTVADTSHTAHHETPKLKMFSPSSSATLQGVTHRRITRGKDMLKGLQSALRFGQAQRATCSTSVHGRSSRSHLVMMLYLLTCDESGSQHQLGRLSLVDLAGSERIKCSEATGDRLREAQHINRSLSALADVVVAKEKGVPHVPYRNSKLTHLLQDALGGQQNSRTTIIIALPPTRAALGETLHSLQLSSRLNSIAAQRMYVPWSGHQRGVEEDDSLLARQEAERLRLENVQLRNRIQQLEERDQERDLELQQLRQQIQVQPCSTETCWRSTSPPSPVLEADSSAEQSREISECQVREVSPIPADELQPVQPEPEIEAAARALDFSTHFSDGIFESSPQLKGVQSVQDQQPFAEQRAEHETSGHSSEADWKWTDPKDASLQDASLQLHLVPSPARSQRRSEVQHCARSSPAEVSSSEITVSASPEQMQASAAIEEQVAAEDVAAEDVAAEGSLASPSRGLSLSQTLPAHGRPSLSVPARARSASCRSREYVVEAITPSEAEQLTRSALAWSKSITSPGGGVAPFPETWVDNDDEFLSAKTDFLVLSQLPGSPKDSDGSPGHISVSSDEAEIKDRLKALLKHRPVKGMGNKAGGHSIRFPGATRCAPLQGAGPTTRGPKDGSVNFNPTGSTSGARRQTTTVTSQSVQSVAAGAASAVRTPRDASREHGAGRPQRENSIGPVAGAPRATRERAAARVAGQPIRTPRDARGDSCGRGINSPSTRPALRATVSTTAAMPPSTPRQVRPPPGRAVSASPQHCGPCQMTWSGLRPVPARHSLQSRPSPASPLGSCGLAWQTDLRSPPLARLVTPRQRAFAPPVTSIADCR